MLMTKLLRSLESWQSNQPQYSLSGQRFSCVNLAFRFSRSVFIEKAKKKAGRGYLLHLGTHLFNWTVQSISLPVSMELTKIIRWKWNDVPPGVNLRNSSMDTVRKDKPLFYTMHLITFPLILRDRPFSNFQLFTPSWRGLFVPWRKSSHSNPIVCAGDWVSQMQFLMTLAPTAHKFKIYCTFSPLLWSLQIRSPQ